MIDPGPALRALVLSDGTVTGLADSRMFPMVMPQGERRASLVYQEISDIGAHTLEGPTGLAEIRVQITAWAQNRDTAIALANAVRDVIDGYAGTVSFGSESPQAELLFKGIFFDSGGASYDSASDLYGARRDYFLRYDH